LSGEFHGSDAALAEKQARKGSGARAAAHIVPTTEELARRVAKSAAEAPPEPGPVLDGWDDIDLSDLNEPGAESASSAEPSAIPVKTREAAEPEVAAEQEDELDPKVSAESEPESAGAAEVEAEPPRGLAQGLQKTKGGFVARIGRLFSSKKRLDDETIEELEELLLTADIGVRTSQRLLEAVQVRFADGEIEAEQVWDLLRAETSSILASSAGELTPTSPDGPFVLLMVGVNGAGKTTTIGKLASHYVSEGKSVMMVAGDTFRAAAVNQLVEWANRVGCEIHIGQDEGDPSGVIFDGIKKGIESKVDVILCDTAGRLQTKKPLMDELGKIVRVSGKALPGAPHETVLVIDANTGQNAIQQAQLFRDAAPLTGLILTKLDGTAKGGVVIGISEEMQLPIYHIGIGEAVTELRPFDPAEFVDALF
jgi:fused signal recognition particle receptor